MSPARVEVDPTLQGCLRDYLRIKVAYELTYSDAFLGRSCRVEHGVFNVLLVDDVLVWFIDGQFSS